MLREFPDHLTAYSPDELLVSTALGALLVVSYPGSYQIFSESRKPDTPISELKNNNAVPGKGITV